MPYCVGQPGEEDLKHAQLSGAQAGDEVINVRSVFTKCVQLSSLLQVLFKEGYPPLVYLWDIWCGLEEVFELAEGTCPRIQLRLKLDVQ